MNDLSLTSHRKKGAEMIKSFCAMHLFSLGVNLNFIDWSTNILSDEEQHILKLDNGTLDVELTFHASELLTYARSRHMRKTEIKIKRGLKRIVTK